jgi:hypothetical protein
VIAEIDKMVSQEKREDFLVELAKREIKLNRQRQAIQDAAGAWKPEDHPELAEGSGKWVREIRQESLRRFERIEQHRQSE